MTSLEMITLQELLRDPQYREYFLKAPKLPPHYTAKQLPWRLFIQKPEETAWRAKRFGTYREAFEGYRTLTKKGIVANAAINCPALTFLPPLKTVRVKGRFVTVRGKQKPLVKTIVWKPRIEADMADHSWCGYCRRPTIFKTLAVNINRKGAAYTASIGEPEMRCTICSASARIINLRDPLVLQKWDPNRPYIADMVA